MQVREHTSNRHTATMSRQPQEVLMPIANRLRELLNEAELTPKALANKVEYSESAISLYLSAKARPTPGFLSLTGDALGWNPNYIKTGKGEKYLKHTLTVSGNRYQNSVSQNALGNDSTQTVNQSTEREQLLEIKLAAKDREIELLKEIIAVLREKK